MGKLSRGWALTKMSFSVIKKDKELLLFPVMSGLLVILLAVSFFAGIYFLEGFEGITSNPISIGLLLVFYFLAYFLGIYFNVALISSAYLRMEGGDPTISYGLSMANKRLKYILQWALFAATVGLILRMISERTGVIGRLVISLIGLAWSIATYFVVPIIAFEEMGPIEAIKKSVSILKAAWGEALIANLGIGLIFLLLGLAGIIPIFLGLFIGGLLAIIIGGLISIIYWVFLAILSSAVSGVLLAALYRFATTGKSSVYIPDSVLKDPFHL